MSSVGRSRSLGTLMHRQTFTGILLPVLRSNRCSRGIFSAFSSTSENENATQKENKDEEKPREEAEMEKLLAQKDTIITEKDSEIKDMKVGPFGTYHL